MSTTQTPPSVRKLLLDLLDAERTGEQYIGTDMHDTIVTALDQWPGEPDVAWEPNSMGCNSCDVTPRWEPHVETRTGYCPVCFALTFADTLVNSDLLA